MSRRLRPDVFVLARSDAHTWRILNKGYGADDACYVVALVREVSEGDVRVEWLQGSPLSTSFRSALDALDDVTSRAPRAAAATRPIPIPHYAPAPQRQAAVGEGRA